MAWDIVVPQKAELTNLVSNPSFELQGTATLGYTAIGAGSSANETVGGIRGRKYLVVTPDTGVNDGIYYGTVALTTGVTYTFSLDFKGTAAVGYKIYFADTSGTLKGTAATFTASTSYWERKTVSWACDSTASYRLYIVKNNSASVANFYIDGLMVVASAYEMTYFDGDTPYCRWSGAAHGSSSVSSAQARNVGRVVSLSTYNLNVMEFDGVGFVTASHQVVEYAAMPGAEYKGHKVQPRYFFLTSQISGSGKADLHSKRKAIIDLFKHDLLANDQPVVLRYSGANSSKVAEISCYLDAEVGSIKDPNVQNVAIRLVAYDPYFYTTYEAAHSLTTVGSGTRNYFAAKRNGAWTAITPSAMTDPGSGITVRGMDLKGSYFTVSPFTPPGGGKVYYQTNERLYVVGKYLNGDGTAAADYIMYYDFAAGTWNAVETGTNGYVRSIAIAPNGYIYACGEFTQIGATAANRIAYWDGDSWVAMGDGFGGTAYDVLVGNDGKVYACGNDATIGAVANAAYVAYWDGTAWQAMSTGIDSIAYSLDKDTAGNIYIAGTQTGRVTKWDGSAFTSLAAPAIAWVVKVDKRGNVYAGMTGSEYIKMWNGQSWQSMAGGFTTGSYVYALDIDADDNLWVGGDFSVVSGLAVNGLACWNGYSWMHPDIYLPASSVVYSIVCRGNDVYLGWDTSGTAYYSYANTVSNGGTARVYPVITINRSGGTSARVMYIRNETTGATLRFDYALQDGETLMLDLSEGRRSVISSYYGDVYRAMVRGSDFSEFYLLPGSNTISVLVYPVGSPTIYSYVTYKERHESIDGVAA